MVWSFVYLALRRSLELVLLCHRSAEANAAREPEFRAEMDRFPQRHGDHRTPRACRDDPDRFREWTARLAPVRPVASPRQHGDKGISLTSLSLTSLSLVSAPAAPLPRPCGARGVPLVDCWISRRTSAHQR